MGGLGDRMKAIQFDHFGATDVLQWVDVPQPVTDDEQLLIKVRSAGVNPIDVKIREGSSFVAQSLTLPAGLGFEVCGEVVDCGQQVSQFNRGDIILGMVGKYDHPCAYAQYCLAKPTDIILKPEALVDVQAGGLPIAGLTAWQALHQHGKVQKGERVLIHAAAGGVGHLAVQFAKLAGAFVIATASSPHHDFLRELGADEIIDYRQVAFEKKLRPIDLVIDLVGGEVGLRSLTVLKSSGRIVTVPTITCDQILEKAKQLGVVAMGILAQTNLEDLKKIADLMANKQVTLALAKTFSLADAAQAHKMFEKKHTQGKIVLTAQ